MLTQIRWLGSESGYQLGAQPGLLTARDPSTGHGLLIAWLLGSKREEDEATRPVKGYDSSATASLPLFFSGQNGHSILPNSTR